MKKKYSICIIMIIIISYLILNAYCNENKKIIIITNKSVNGKIDQLDIKNIYLGKKTKWDDETKIVFYIYDDEKSLEFFLKKFIGKNVHQYKKYWKKKVFTGKGRMPKSSNSIDDIVNLVDKTEASIAFIPYDPLLDKNIQVIDLK